LTKNLRKLQASGDLSFGKQDIQIFSQSNKKIEKQKDTVDDPVNCSFQKDNKIILY
jgi:hypothetical protein